MSGSGHRGVHHAISNSKLSAIVELLQTFSQNRRRRENARLRVFPQENSCLIFLAEKTLKSSLLDEDHPFVCPSFLFFSCVKREFNEEFEIGRRRGVRCTARRLDVCGRKVDGGLEARRAVLPRARRKQEEGGAGGRIFFARSRVAPKHWSLASSLCVASAFCDSEKRTTLSMSGSGHRGVLHAISNYQTLRNS